MGTVVICLPVLINRSPWAHVSVFPDLCVLLVLCYVFGCVFQLKLSYASSVFNFGLLLREATTLTIRLTNRSLLGPMKYAI